MTMADITIEDVGFALCVIAAAGVIVYMLVIQIRHLRYLRRKP